MTSANSEILEAVDVEVPVRTAYNQWTQFEKFPVFMLGVKSVEQIDDSNLRWKIDIGEETREWTARITEQTPDKRIAWTSTSGSANAGVVTFHRLADERCRVTLQLSYVPEGMIENIGDMLGIVRQRVVGDLERFKIFIEDSGAATGGFRGTIEAPS
ncbi:MAG TPA: SRPBCC family protein [Candidatus Limnocylindrales bacterium]|nr:SRPBCC family protein [Candidatus Limnocylindrales bacterium]